MQFTPKNQQNFWIHDFPQWFHIIIRKYCFHYGVLPPNHKTLTCYTWLSSSLRVNTKFLRCQHNGSKHLMLHFPFPGRDSSLGTWIILKILRNINWFVKSCLCQNLLFNINPLYSLTFVIRRRNFLQYTDFLCSFI